jgi:hypothetical protein
LEEAACSKWLMKILRDCSEVSPSPWEIEITAYSSISSLLRRSGHWTTHMEVPKIKIFKISRQKLSKIFLFGKKSPHRKILFAKIIARAGCIVVDAMGPLPVAPLVWGFLSRPVAESRHTSPNDARAEFKSAALIIGEGQPWLSERNAARREKQH